MANYYLRPQGIGGSTAGAMHEPAAWSTGDDSLRGNGPVASTRPVATDDLFIDANSHNALFTNGTQTSFKSLTIADGWTGTFHWSHNLTFAGSFRLGSGTTLTASTGQSLTITASASIKCAGKTLNRHAVINAPGGTVTLEDAFDIGTGNFTLTAGAFVTNNQSVRVTTFGATGSATRSVNAGTSNWTFLGTSALTLASAGLTTTWSDATFTFNGASPSIITAGIRLGHIVVMSSGTFTVSTNSTHVSSFTWNADSNGATLALGNALNIYASPGLVLTGTANNYLTVRSNALGTTRFITSQSNGTPLTLSNVILEDIYWEANNTTSRWATNSGTGLIGDAGGITFTVNQGSLPFTFTAGIDLWLAQNGWNNTAGGFSTIDPSGGNSTPGRVPLPQDNVTINENPWNTGTADIPINLLNTNLCRNLTVTHPTKKLHLGGAGGIRRIHGDLTIPATAAGVYGTGTNIFFLSARRAVTHTIDVQAGNFWHNDFRLYTGGTSTTVITFTNNTRLSAPITRSGFGNTSGTIVCPANLWVARVSGDATSHTLDLRGTHLRLTGVGIVWAVSSQSSNRVTLSDASTVVELTDTSMNVKEINNAGSGVTSMTNGKFVHTVDAPGSVVRNLGHVPLLVIHGGGKILEYIQNYTGSGTALEVVGTAAEPIIVRSNTQGTQRIVNLAGSKFQHVTMRDINHNGGAITVYDSTDLGNNTNFVFAAGPPPWSLSQAFPTYPDRPYKLKIQKDLPAWYIAADDLQYHGVTERGPDSRTVTASTGSYPVYSSPLITEGRALSFAGIGRYDVPAVTGDLSSARTTEFWINTTVPAWQNGIYPGGNTGTYFILGRGTSSSQGTDGIYISDDNVSSTHAERVKAYLFVSREGVSTGAKGTKQLNDGVTHHVVVVVDDVAKTVKAWVDGVLDINVTFTGTVATFNNVFQIGARVNGNSLFNGVLDEFAFYRRALTQQEITNHYNWGKATVAESFQRLKAYLNGSWQEKPLKAYINGAWVEKPLKNYANSQWA